MPEYIDRELLIKKRHGCSRKCTDCDFARDGDSWCEGELFVVDVLRVPSADVVEIVRCKDCKHYIQSAFIDKHMTCKFLGISSLRTKPDGFCSYGVRKDNV